VVALLLNTDKASSQNKNGTEKIFSLQSHLVIPLGLEPRTPTLKVLCSTS
jgi:site-specific DNA recombinase